MSKRTDRDFLSDIREAIRWISTYVIGMSYETFVADTKKQDAVIRNLEIIGSEQLRTENADIPWKSMAGVRDRLIHHYFGVNLNIVWQIATIELPQVFSLLNKSKEDQGEGVG